MLPKQSTLFLFFLMSTIGAAVLSLFDVTQRMDRLVIDGNTLAGVGHDEWQHAKALGPIPSLEEIIKQGDTLRAETLADDTWMVVQKIDAKLSELLALGTLPTDAISIINSFFIEAKELVLTAVGEKTFTLLKLLQLIYIWRDEAQFHWFQALSFDSPWYDLSMWNTYPMFWLRNFRAICKVDNGALALATKNQFLTKTTWKSFREEVIILCAEYDAIKVFDATQIEPARLKNHVEILAKNSSVKLLRAYKASSGIGHLHLEKFSLPKKLPVNVEDFNFLLKNGYKFLPMNQLIRRFCIEGRLDLLKRLHQLKPKVLIPDQWDLCFAAERGQLSILQWAYQEWGFNEDLLNSLFHVLAVNCHLQALDWIVDTTKMIIDSQMIGKIIKAGAPLKALQRIDEKQRIMHGRREWVDWATKDCRLPVLKWLCKIFGFFPSVKFLGNATTEMLDWIKATCSNLIQPALLRHGAGNFELLKWVYENAPSSIFDTKKMVLSKSVFCMEMMVWLYKKLKICSFDMDWAYETGDLKAIQWAKKTCEIEPVEENICTAARRGHLQIIKWFHEHYPSHLYTSTILRLAIENGNVKVADYALSNFTLKEKINVNVRPSACAERYPSTLRWIYEHTSNIMFHGVMHWASSMGDFSTIKWVTEKSLKIRPDSETWNNLAAHGYDEIYKWFLVRYPEKRFRVALLGDILAAMERNHLNVLKVILDKKPSLFKDIPVLKTTKANYHVKQWLYSTGKYPTHNWPSFDHKVGIYRQKFK